MREWRRRKNILNLMLTRVEHPNCKQYYIRIWCSHPKEHSHEMKMFHKGEGGDIHRELLLGHLSALWILMNAPDNLYQLGLAYKGVGWNMRWNWLAFLRETPKRPQINAVTIPKCAQCLDSWQKPTPKRSQIILLF